MPTRKAEGIELLADPTRRRIVALIAGRIWHPADIAKAIGLSRPATSRQLRLLAEADLIRWRWSPIDGRSRDYAINPAMLEPILAWLAGVDLRGVRPPFQPTWAPPMRVHRLRRLERTVLHDRDVPLDWNHRDSGLGGGVSATCDEFGAQFRGRTRHRGASRSYTSLTLAV